jgi:tricorn protease
VRQVTRFETLDVAFPAIGPREIVFSVGSSLYLLDLGTEQQREVEIEVVTDRATLKPRQEKVDERIDWAGISPSGKRAVFGARGEVFTVPAEHGVTRNLTHSSGVAERHPAWSPDGDWIAYHSDRSGEYELTLRAAEGSGEERRLTTMGPGYRYDVHWSPDSKKLVFVDQAMNINLYDIDAERLTQIDKGHYMFHGALSGFVANWSDDSRWIAWARTVDKQNSAVFVYDNKEQKLHQVTSGFYVDDFPVFDPDGKYLYFTSNRTFNPSYSDVDNSWVYANTTNIVAVSLRKDVPSPLAPRNDEEGEEDEKEGNGKKKKKDKKVKGEDKKDEKEEQKEPEPVEIDLEGFERRLVVLPAEAGNYSAVDAASGKVVYHRRPRTGSGPDGKSPVVYYDLEEREEKTILADADGFTISADDKKMLVVDDRKFAIVDVAADQKMEKQIDLSGLAMDLDPVAEWRQIFRDAWRFERDYFYDPNMHGIDWNGLRERYGALLDDVVTRCRRADRGAERVARLPGWR